MAKIPIIILHLGNQDYLKLAIKQAEYYNNDVILIGDETNKEFCKNHYYHNDLKTNDSFLFNKIYKHFSPNNQAFEKICIERWFIIHNLFEKLKLEKAFICDSDVLVYTNIDSIHKDYPDDMYFVSMRNNIVTNSAVSFWSKNKLREFCDSILLFYQNDLDYIENYWNNYENKLKGGISDMYLLYCFLTNKQFSEIHFKPDLNLLNKENDLCQVKNNQFFDNSIDFDTDGFETYKWESEFFDFNTTNIENKKKKFTWIDNLPYCYNTNLNKNIKALAIHFHGCKNIMADYITFKKPNTMSAVLFSLNDDYTKDNKERFIICLNYMLETVDEVVYIDWGSPNNISLLDIDFVKLNIKNHEKIKHIKISRDQIKKIVPADKHFIQHSIIRNIGIRHATGEYIISTNVDIIFPRKNELLNIITNDDKKTLYSINRKDIDMLITTAIYNHARHKLLDIIGNFIEFRNHPNDVDPISKFENDVNDMIKKTDNTDTINLFKHYIKYSKIWNCGDFQMAHREIWNNIRGFEENMQDSAMGTDSNIHKKICNYGYKLQILNRPHIFHMSHPARSAHNNTINDMSRFFVNFEKTENNENWGQYI